MFLYSIAVCLGAARRTKCYHSRKYLDHKHDQYIFNNKEVKGSLQEMLYASHAWLCLRIDRIVEMAGSARVVSQLHRDSAVGVRVDMMYVEEIRLINWRHDVVIRESMH